MTWGSTLRITGWGTFSAGEKPVGADRGVTGCTLDIQGGITLCTNGGSVSVAIAENGTAPDSVSVPRDLGNGRQLFVRLSARIP